MHVWDLLMSETKSLSEGENFFPRDLVSPVYTELCGLDIKDAVAFHFTRLRFPMCPRISVSMDKARA